MLWVELFLMAGSILPI